MSVFVSEWLCQPYEINNNDGFLVVLYIGPTKVELTRLLIEKGARLNAKTDRGYTPLDRCVFYFVLGNYNREVLVTLVVAGAILRPVTLQS